MSVQSIKESKEICKAQRDRERTRGKLLFIRPYDSPKHKRLLKKMKKYIANFSDLAQNHIIQIANDLNPRMGADELVCLNIAIAQMLLSNVGGHMIKESELIEKGCLDSKKWMNKIEQYLRMTSSVTLSLQKREDAKSTYSSVAFTRRDTSRELV